MDYNILEIPYYVAFPIDKIINEILDSYGDCNVNPDKIRKIHNQLSIDYHRMKIYYNSVMYRTVESYLFMIKKLKNVPHTILPSLYHALIMFSTQAPFYYHFSILNNLLDNQENVYLIQDSEPATVEIIHRDNHINLILRKSFKRINVRTDIVYDKYDVSMIIDLNKNSYGFLMIKKVEKK